MKTVGIYAGSFDPPTNGHAWMINQARSVVDQLIVAIGQNPKKTPKYSLQARHKCLMHMTMTMDQVTVLHFDNQYLVNFAKEVRATHIIRGIRDQHDFVYEQKMRQFNSDINPNIQTIFLIPPQELILVSSSFVKDLVGPEGWQEIVKQYVPRVVLEEMIRTATGD